MSIDSKMSQIEHLERLVSSKSLRIEELEKELSRVKRFYIQKVEKLDRAFEMEYKRAELLQYDLNVADDFISEVCESYSLKYSRKPS